MTSEEALRTAFSKTPGLGLRGFRGRVVNFPNPPKAEDVEAFEVCAHLLAEAPRERNKGISSQILAEIAGARAGFPVQVGILIAAAIHLGIPYGRIKLDPNAYLKVGNDWTYLTWHREVGCETTHQ